jgi:hypothetical protein
MLLEMADRMLRQVVLRVKTHGPAADEDEYTRNVTDAWDTLHAMLSDTSGAFYDGVASLDKMEAEAEHTTEGIHFDVLLSLVGHASETATQPSLCKPKLRRALQARLGPTSEVISKRVVPQQVDASQLCRNIEES